MLMCTQLVLFIHNFTFHLRCLCVLEISVKCDTSSTFFKRLLQYTSSDSTSSQMCALGHPSCFREKGQLFKVLHAFRCQNSLTVISHLTNHFSFIWIGTNMITQLVCMFTQIYQMWTRYLPSPGSCIIHHSLLQHCPFSSYLHVLHW